MTTATRGALITELCEAINDRSEARKVLHKCSVTVADAKSELSDARAAERAASQKIEEIEREIYSGKTGLPLIDAAKNGDS